MVVGCSRHMIIFPHVGKLVSFFYWPFLFSLQSNSFTVWSEAFFSVFQSFYCISMDWWLIDSQSDFYMRSHSYTVNISNNKQLFIFFMNQKNTVLRFLTGDPTKTRTLQCCRSPNSILLNFGVLSQWNPAAGFCSQSSWGKSSFSVDTHQTSWPRFKHVQTPSLLSTAELCLMFCWLTLCRPTKRRISGSKWKGNWTKRLS